MHKSNEDCFYFLTSSCAKGALCTYRHSPLALTCKIICPSWSRGNCLDPACPYRHTAAQRPIIGNGIMCFYENTPMGCLKPDCTFIHSRPRTHLRNAPPTRPSSVALVNKDVTKPALVPNPPPVATPQAAPVVRTEASSSQPTNNETQLTAPSVNTEPSSSVKPEVVIRRIAVPSNSEPTNETKSSTDNNNPTLKKSTSRSVITDSTKDGQDEMSTAPSRLVVNRNVVLPEPVNVPNRTIVLTTPTSVGSPSSTRVVLSSDAVKISSKVKSKDADVSEQENTTKKFKSDSQSTVHVPSPCSTPTIVTRLSSTPSKEATPANNAKPIRLKRDRLPAAKVANGNSSNEEQPSAGTGLPQDNERRTMRLERFQKKPTSSPRSIVSLSPNERKRTAPETTPKEAPPRKRLSISVAAVDQSAPRQTTSSIRNKQADEFTNKRTLPNNSLSTPALQAAPTSSSSSGVRPRFVAQPIVAPLLQQTSATRTPRLRQPPSVVIKRPLLPVTAPSQAPAKPTEAGSSTTSNKTALERPPSNPANREDENRLLASNEPTDVVDTFALIDEALLEADHLLELM